MLTEEKKLLLNILAEIKELKFLLPAEISLSDISHMVGKPNNTLRKYLISNFEPEVDYQKKDGKLYVKQDVVLCMRRHYAK